MGELILSTIVLSMDDKKIGLQIKKARLDAGLSQEDLAKHLNLTWEMISRYENGRSSAVKHVPKLAEIMNKPISYFIEKEKPKDTFTVNDIVNKLKEEGVSYSNNYKNVVKLVDKISGEGLEDDIKNSKLFIETTAEITSKYPDLFAIKIATITTKKNHTKKLLNLPEDTIGFFDLSKKPNEGDLVITFNGIEYGLAEYNKTTLAAPLAVLIKIEVEF